MRDRESFENRYSQSRVVDQYRLYKFNLLQLTFQKEFSTQDVLQFQRASLGLDSLLFSNRDIDIRVKVLPLQSNQLAVSLKYSTQERLSVQVTNDYFMKVQETPVDREQRQELTVTYHNKYNLLSVEVQLGD